MLSRVLPEITVVAFISSLVVTEHANIDQTRKQHEMMDFMHGLVLNQVNLSLRVLVTDDLAGWNPRIDLSQCLKQLQLDRVEDW